jgi:hypothetical protein
LNQPPTAREHRLRTQAHFAIDFVALDRANLSGMVPRFSAGAVRVSQRPLHGAVFSLILGCLTFASAGCSYLHPTPTSAPPTEQQLAAYAEQEAAIRGETSFPNEKPQVHCDQLATATPGGEELRITDGAIESRQWTLIANGSAPRWAFVRPKDGPPDGWAPKPGIAKLDFQPPLDSALTAGSSHFLAYAPVESHSLEDSQKSATVREVFGAAQGDFTWRGRKYSYTLTSELPCFPVLQ